MSAITFGSVCSGIEAASVAWRPLGWKAAFVSEIDKAASAVLAHHYPDTPNFGDMTKWETWPDAALDVLVGGTPCQSFSVAGLRKGLDDPRGSLMLVFGAIARRYRPRWIVWENVPGVLSSNGGRDFGAFLGMLGELGYGFAYRVLDAQFFGLAQRRARVFVVGYLGDWRPPAAVLFERESLRGDSAPRREAGETLAATLGASAGGVSGKDAADGRVTPTLTGGARASGGYSHDEIPLARCDTAREGNRQDYETTTMVTHALTGEGFDASEDGTGRGTPLVVHGTQEPYVGDIAFALGRNNGGESALFSITPSNSNKDYNARQASKSQALTAGGNRPSARGGDLVAFAQNQRDEVRAMNIAGALAGEPGMKQQTFIASTAVRRLTPRECERLQGFPDDYTAIPYRGKQMADGPRYKMLGNSMAVPVMAWIGERIALVNDLTAQAGKQSLQVVHKAP